VLWIVEDALTSVSSDDDVGLVVVSVYGADGDGRPLERAVNDGVGIERLSTVIV
jgi:hypothetical protein